MKATTLFSDSKIVTNKMRDQLYMKHLRQVEKINNREADQVTKGIQVYRSINDLHRKYKSNAFDWHTKQESQIILQQNKKMDRKIKQIKSYLQFVLPRRPQSIDLSKIKLQQNQHNTLPDQKYQDATKKQDKLDSKQSAKKQKANYTFHYRYRKRVQEQIQRQNQKLAKGIMSQRGSYLPQIYRNKRSISVAGKNSKGLSSLQELKPIQ